MYNRSQPPPNYSQGPSSPPISGRTRARTHQQQQGLILDELDELPEKININNIDDSFQDSTYVPKRKHKRTSSNAYLDDDEDEDNDNELGYLSSKRRDRSSASIAKDKKYNNSVPGRSSYTREHELEQQLIDLQNQFNELKDVRLTEPEELCQLYRDVTKRQKEARDVIIESLQGELDGKERENKELKKENQELKNDALQQQQRMRQGWDTEKEQLIAKTAVLEAQVAHLKAERQEYSLSQFIPSNDKYKHFLETYEDLSGMFVTDVKQTNDGYTYNCIQNGSHGTIQFKLHRQDTRNSREFKYQPILDPKRDSELLSHLPAKMTRDIEFGQDRASAFHCKLTYALLKQKKSE
ncbi:hypothetical protein INT45_008060 [Circinella minor]|uniref:Monopolin complex subunit Csm1/Pcs1 C-terminal domain-containing protein n=1 Tax=Circinella minor TaxID=1195481 RepID=A0A8H7SBA0_9FUNG|nr:hypothetical protein INT45_008060 [Circinella minor]